MDCRIRRSSAALRAGAAPAQLSNRRPVDRPAARLSTSRAAICRRSRATLRDHPDLRFTLLAELTAVDFWPREPRFELVYLLVPSSIGTGCD